MDILRLKPQNKRIRIFSTKFVDIDQYMTYYTLKLEYYTTPFWSYSDEFFFVTTFVVATSPLNDKKMAFLGPSLTKTFRDNFFSFVTTCCHNRITTRQNRGIPVFSY